MSNQAIFEAIEKINLQEQKVAQLFKDNVLASPHFLRWKLQEYRKITQENYHNPGVKDDVLLKVLKGETKQLEQNLYPASWKRVLNKIQYSNKSFLKRQNIQKKIKNGMAEIWKSIKLIPQNYRTQLINLKTKNENFMNNENLQYLSDNLKYMGFGENLKPELEKKLNEGKGEFQLHYNANINKKPFAVTMNFRKSETTDMYFFNNYHASLEKGKDEKAEQTFYLNKGKGVTGKEAFNLLDGRSVHKDLLTKEGQPYKAWMQLDFENKDKNNNFEVKQFHEKYGFDLKAAVEKFPITDMKEPDKEKALMQSLQKGNVQSVTIEKDGSSHKMFIEADPQFKKVNLYDSNMKLVVKESIEIYQSVGKIEASLAVKEEQENDKKKDLKQDLKPEKEKVEKKNDKTLLPKKRERSKKGLGVS